MTHTVQASTEPLDLREMWPDIFRGMTVQQVRDIEQVVASSWHEGMEPDRDHTARLAARVRGDISKAEYRRLEGLPPTIQSS